jgi:hypothetical protein
MADGTLILGVTAVLTSGVFGPLVLHQTEKDRDDRTDRRAVLDEALASLSLARSQETWLETWLLAEWPPERLPIRAELDSRAKELFDQAHLLEAVAVRLNIRLGNGKLVDSYVAAVAETVEQAGALWRYQQGLLEMQVATRIVLDAEDQFAIHYDRLLDAARRWHQDNGLPSVA